ncbi:hypothetical protein Tco_0715356 [Tanacetum coccineum]
MTQLIKSGDSNYKYHWFEQLFSYLMCFASALNKQHLPQLSRLDSLNFTGALIWRFVELQNEITCSLRFSQGHSLSSHQLHVGLDSAKGIFYLHTEAIPHIFFSTTISKQATFSSTPNSLPKLLILDSRLAPLLDD